MAGTLLLFLSNYCSVSLYFHRVAVAGVARKVLLLVFDVEVV